jgi:hypothetical protein
MRISPKRPGGRSGKYSLHWTFVSCSREAIYIYMQDDRVFELRRRQILAGDRSDQFEHLCHLRRRPILVFTSVSVFELRRRHVLFSS